MRLNYLWIENYKNLRDMTINFEKGNGLTMLIGANGSGKSNILEAVSKIFAGAYSRPKNNPLSCSFLLCYSISDRVVYIAGHGTKSIVANIVLAETPDDFSGVDITENDMPEFVNRISSMAVQFSIGGRHFFSNHLLNQEDYLPKRVIAVYSGDETRLQDIYRPFNLKYIWNARKGGVSSNPNRMIYLDKMHWSIALLTLALSSLDDNRKFLYEKVGIKQINRFNFRINSEPSNNIQNPLLRSFIDKLFPSKQLDESMSEEEIRRRLGDLVSPERELFQYFHQAHVPDGRRNRIIKEMNIEFDESLDTFSLSEGEKKLLLIRCALDIVAEPDSLILMDEPDSHVHEVRKKHMYDIFREYSKHGRQIVVTTHSPTLANIYNCEGRIMLERNEDGSIRQIPFENVRAVEQLTDGIWSAVEQNIFFSSNKPLILTEGKSDIAYIKKAIEILKSDENSYEKIDCDFLHMGGASNAKDFIDHLKPHINSKKKVIIIFDRDGAGSDGINKCIETEIETEIKVKHVFDVYKRGDAENWYYFMLPKSEERYSNFIIEDYLPKELKMKIFEDMNTGADGQMNKYPKDIIKYLKNKLSDPRSFESYTSDTMSGFCVLLDVLVKIIDGIYDC